MTYSCDIDIVKPSFSATSAAKVYGDIAKEMALFWQKSNLFMSTEYALHNSLEAGEFIICDGVMIANTTLMQIDRPVHMLHKLSNKLDVEQASDDECVDLVFTLISPENERGFHLRRLSRITRLFQNQEFCDRLRKLEDKDTIRALFMYSDLEEEAA